MYASTALLILAALCFGQVTSNGKGFACSNYKMDPYRKLFLDFHNGARLRVAKGIEPKNGGYLNPAKNMYKLTLIHAMNLSWNDLRPKPSFFELPYGGINFELNLFSTFRKICEVDFTQNAITSCPLSLGNWENKAQNLMRYYSSNGFSNPTTTINSALNNWWSGKNGVNDPQNKYNNGQLYAFSNMISSETTKIGCAYQVCGTYMTVTCLYNGLGYFTDKSMWETGSACRTGSECTTYKNSRCESGLCIKGPDVPETNKKCPKNHGMTDSVRETFLTMHNKLRSSLALGREPDALGGNAPWAARMPRMVYDCKVEASALRNALRCVYGHSNDRNGLGENIYRTTALNFDKNKAAKEASQLWWDELKKFGVGKSTNLTEEMWYLKGGKIGHYTQMAWDRTRKLGCAVTHCNHMTYVVCQYGPGGNYMNKLIYSVGAPCSKCPPKAKCDRNEGLCYFA